MGGRSVAATAVIGRSYSKGRVLLRLALRFGSVGRVTPWSTGLSMKLFSLPSLSGVLGVELSSESEYRTAMMPVEVSREGLIVGVEGRWG